jgi:predicted DsbA family dithiol-disulfide isomerase
VNGVPFFVFDGRWAVSGAQSAEFFAGALREVAAQA